jgi:hypothetical protein
MDGMIGDFTSLWYLDSPLIVHANDKQKLVPGTVRQKNSIIVDAVDACAAMC